MLESFVIMVREGIEAALVVGIILTVLRRSGRRDLERPVYWGLGTAILASAGAAAALTSLPLNEEVTEGALYWTSAAFVLTMLGWMHRQAKTLRAQIEQRVQRLALGEAPPRLPVAPAAQAGASAQQALVRRSGWRWGKRHPAPRRSAREAWGLGAFAFLMVFREGAETVMFLSAVNLTTDALLSFIGSVIGLGVAVAFAVMFVRGSLHVDLRRFFTVTTWVLAIFVLQLLVNGYHEFAEAGLVPATQRSMALVGPLVRNNSLFILAIVAIPLFIWLTATRRPLAALESLAAAERRLALARARSERLHGYGAIAMTAIVLVSVGLVYAREIAPKALPAPEMLRSEGGFLRIPLSALEDGRLHRYGHVVCDRTVRFLALKTADGRVRTALDACRICGSFGYVQEDSHLICLNCSAEINPLTVGAGGGCNPIPLESEVSASAVRVRVAALEDRALLFAAAEPAAQTEIDPVCGMRVRIAEAAAFETVGGKIHYFCSERCRAGFITSSSRKRGSDPTLDSRFRGNDRGGR